MARSASRSNVAASGAGQVSRWAREAARRRDFGTGDREGGAEAGRREQPEESDARQRRNIELLGRAIWVKEGESVEIGLLGRNSGVHNHFCVIFCGKEFILPLSSFAKV
jgi:hypothetical protein